MDLSSLSKIKNKSIIMACVVAASVIGASAVKGESSDAGTTAETEKVCAQQKAEPAEKSPEEDGFEFEELISFKKAGIEEYDMEIVAPDTALEAKKSEKEDTDTHFTVKMPEDKSTILKPEKGAASNPGSRSIAGEYYTVYDEISGGHVTLNGHELICRIVNSEIGDSWGEEAIKAQAVAAYSYVRFNDERGYVPSVGLKAGYSAKLERCVSAVEGQCVYYSGSIIDAVYSASSAGASAPSEKIWGAAHPYLRAVESIYDSKDPNYGVVKRFTKDELKTIIEKNTDVKLSDDPRNWFEIESVFSGKYVDLMKLDGKQVISINGSQRRVTGALMRSNILGVGNLKSTAFEISYDDGVFTFKTYGWGHGVGMSQWGACLYARAGYTYDQILRHYYTNTNVAVSGANAKAVERAKMTQEQLAKAAEEARLRQEAEERAAAEALAASQLKKTVDAAPSAQEPQEEQPALAEPVQQETVDETTQEQDDEAQPVTDEQTEPSEEEIPASEQPQETEETSEQTEPASDETEQPADNEAV